MSELIEREKQVVDRVLKIESIDNLPEDIKEELAMVKTWIEKCLINNPDEWKALLEMLDEVEEAVKKLNI